MALARIIATFHDAERARRDPRLLRRGARLGRRRARGDPAAAVRRGGLPHETGAPALGGEDGYSTLERIWTRPTCEVNGLLSGYTGEGAKTVLPSKAMAKVSCRLVPDQTPEEIERLMEAHVQRVAPKGVTVTVHASARRPSVARRARRVRCSTPRAARSRRRSAGSR